MKSRLAWLGVVLATASAISVSPLACSSDDASTPSPGDAAIDGTTSGDGATIGDGGAPRTFRMSSGGVQLLVSGPAIGLQITPADLATDVDIVEIHQEFYGVPWDAFAAHQAPPAEWDALMKSLAKNAQSMNKPVFLSISMLNGGRSTLAAKTTVNGSNVGSTDDWAASCYDFATAADGATMKAAYLAYVDYMIDTFAPGYLNLAIEVNLFFEKCPAAAAGLIDVANAAYDEAHAKKASIIAFPSFQIDHLYGYSNTCPAADADGGTPADRDACFAANFAQIEPMKRDRFAMSSYPQLSVVKKAADMPADWFSRGAKKKNEIPLIAETGWNSSSLVAELSNGTCDTVIDDTESEEQAYLDFVLGSADTAHIDLVNWWSNRDLVVSTFMTDCPCTFDTTWCSVLQAFRGPDAGPDAGETAFFGEIVAKAFGTMGLRSYDGTQKPSVYARWQSALARPLGN